MPPPTHGSHGTHRHRQTTQQTLPDNLSVWERETPEKYGKTKTLSCQLLWRYAGVLIVNQHQESCFESVSRAVASTSRGGRPAIWPHHTQLLPRNSPDTAPLGGSQDIAGEANRSSIEKLTPHTHIQGLFGLLCDFSKIYVGEAGTQSTTANGHSLTCAFLKSTFFSPVFNTVSPTITNMKLLQKGIISVHSKEKECYFITSKWL